MYKNLVRISTKDMSHEQWLEERRNAIGGSDAPSVIGVNPYSSPYAVYCDKLGMLPAKEENEAMRQGTDLESYVARRFEMQTGKKVRKCNSILYNPEYPFAHANVDRLILGEDAGLECKTTSQLNMKKFKNGEYPANYYVQSMHYMMVTGAAKWYLAVLIYSKEFLVFEIERDEDEIQALAKAEKEFWDNHVATNQPPEADSSRSTEEALGIVFDLPAGGELIATSEQETYIKSLIDLKAQKKELEDEIRGIENAIKSDMGDNETLKGEGGVITWKAQDKRTFDYKALLKDYPDIEADKYYKTTTSRVFRAKEVKNE